MTSFVASASCLLLLSLVLSLRVVAIARREPEKMLGILLVGTSGCAVALLMSRWLSEPAGLDLALVFALLAAVVGVAFVARTKATSSKVCE